VSFDLPALPEGWSFLPLEDCAAAGSISYGVVQPGSPVEGGVPIIRVNNFRNARLDLSDVMRIAPEIESKYGRTRLSGGEVLLTLVGTVGQVAEASAACRGFNVARAVGVIKPTNGIDAKWIAICLRSPLSQHILGARANTTVQTTINLKDVRALPIPIPPSVERVRIADFISALDDRIALLRETNATLEAIAQALFKSWFVDFDPVRAKQQGIAPAGMDEATAALFPDSFEESAMGLVPKGWPVQTLEDLLVLQRGFDLPAQSRTPGCFPIIAASGPSGTHAIAMAAGPGVVTGRSGVLGRVFLELGDYWPLNTTLWVKEFRAATPCFAYELLRLLDFKAFNAGSAVPTLNRNHIHGLPYLAPARSCVEAFERIAMHMHERVRVNEQQAQTLATLRDTLLPRLISGQLRLPTVTADLSEALA
jgi:type I restriction enzyme, S subunit